MFQFQRINTRIALVFMVLIIVLILASNTLLYVWFSKILITRVLDDQKNILFQNKDNIENIVKTVNQATVYLYGDRTLADILEKCDQDALITWNDRSNLSELFRNYMNAPITIGNNQYEASLYVDTRFPIADHLGSHMPGELRDGLYGVFNTSGIMETAWYKKTMDKNGELHTFMLAEDKGKVYIARLIRNRYIKNFQYNDIVGIVVVGVDMKTFKATIDASKLTEGTCTWLLNDESRIIYSNKEETIGKDASAAGVGDALGRYVSGETFFLDMNGIRFFGFKYDLQWKWRLVSLTPYRDIVQELDGIRNFNILITVLALVAGSILTLLLSRSITKPIAKLAATMQEVRDEKHFVMRLAAPTRDEVGVLYESFNEMMGRIDKLLADVYESTNREKKAEMKALQAQINPHFIYNTLDSINWMALVHNEDEIVIMVSALAFILRYSVRDPYEMVYLEEEIMHVEKYASIQKLRYPDSFSIVTNILPSLLHMKVPRVILQPLVENAILHGIKKGSGTGTIWLEGSCTEDFLRLSVSDNGAGADTYMLNHCLEDENTVLHNSDGVGIRNVHKRIRLFFGEAYGLKYRNNEPVGIIAEITMPVQPSQHEQAELEDAGAIHGGVTSLEKYNDISY